MFAGIDVNKISIYLYLPLKFVCKIFLFLCVCIRSNIIVFAGIFNTNFSFLFQVILQYIAFAIGNFVYTTGAAVLRENGEKSSLMWYGTFTIIGKFVAAILLFLIINVAHVFESVDQCA